MNRGQLVTRVARKLSLDTTVGGEELTLLQEWANEAVVEVLVKTRCFVDIGELTLSAGVKDYRIDATVLTILERTIETSYAPITVLSPADIYDLRRGQNVSSPARYLASEGGLLMVYPTPASSGEVIRFLFVPKPTLMTSDAHDPSETTYGGILTEYHFALESYMTWKAAEYDDKMAPAKPVDLMALFEKDCREVRRRHRSKAGRGFSPARVGYPGTHRYPRRNDVYPAG